MNLSGGGGNDGNWMEMGTGEGDDESGEQEAKEDIKKSAKRRCVPKHSPP